MCLHVCVCVCTLQAILSRKLVVPEMEEVMKKVAKLSVTGSNAMIRIHCRQVQTPFLLSHRLIGRLSGAASK